METIQKHRLEEIKMYILKMKDELDYLDPFDHKDNIKIIKIKKKLKFYIDILTPESKKPSLRLIKN